MLDSIRHFFSVNGYSKSLQGLTHIYIWRDLRGICSKICKFWTVGGLVALEYAKDIFLPNVVSIVCHRAELGGGGST